MNVERLFAIAEAVKEDLETTGLVGKVTTLADALDQQAREPGQPAHQESVVNARDAVVAAAHASGVNEFSPAWRQGLDEIGQAEILGAALIDVIEGAFLGNELTPTSAAETIREQALNPLQTLEKQLTALTNALDHLGFDADTLEPGEVEIGVVIPRVEVNEELAELAAELDWFDGALRPFDELVTGSRSGFRVRAIASSDFMAFVEAAAKVAFAFGVAVDRLMAAYLKIIDIRLKRHELKQLGLSEEELEPVETHAGTRMMTAVNETVDELVEQHLRAGTSEGRTNELRTELTYTLSQVANRIDSGYSFELRMAPATPDDEDSSGELEGAAEIAGLSDGISTAQKGIAALEELSLESGIPVEGILGLPEAPAQDDTASDEE